MMLQVNRGILTVLDDRQMASWDAFVGAHDAGSVYHTSAWRSVVKKAYGHEPLYFALMDEMGSIIAGLPVFLVRSSLTGTRLSTLPCAQSCDPLVGEEQHYHDLKQGILEFMSRRGIQNWEMKTTKAFTFEKGDTAVSHDDYVNHVLRIDRSVNDLFSNLHKSSIQRAIRKANRYGLVLRRCDSPQGVPPFYKLYAQMRRKEGLLPQPRKFFDALWEHLAPGNMIDILYAEYQGRLLSTILLLKYKDTVIYEYGATEEGANAFSPSPFLLWEAIRHAAGEGRRTFGFGRSASTEDGLIQFKVPQQNLWLIFGSGSLPSV